MDNPITAVWRFIFGPPSVKSLLQRQLYEAEREEIVHRGSAEQMAAMSTYHAAAADMNTKRAARLRESLCAISVSEDARKQIAYPPHPVGEP